ncbi:MAG: LPP20 family lipoprotein [Gammaproteobacteria bacterium]|nr:LPP20 family lipoprotein [Gammaproteobacteria bacterium]
MNHPFTPFHPLRLFAYTLLATSLLLGGCSGNKSKDNIACAVPDAPDVEAPGWVCDEPVEGVAVSAVGISDKSAAGHAFMKQIAAAEARVQLAQIVEVHIQNLVKLYAETTGAADTETVDKVNSSVTKQITDQTLVGTRIFKTLTSPKGALYVLLGLDPDTAKTITESVLNSSMNNDRAQWQQFRAQKGHEELAKEIADFREFKKGN